MLKFFRWIRRKLLNERNLRKYLVYSAREIFKFEGSIFCVQVQYV